jgi:glycosyltransferase involved in cell wall biosynthesis
MGKGRIAFVTPRYGDSVVGGSEAVMREAAHGFAARGWEVEVLTSCALSHYTWADELPAGTSTDGDVTVRRFAADRPRSLDRWARLEIAVASGRHLPDAEQQAWANGRWRLPDLFQHLLGCPADAVVFSPYVAWTTFAGAAAVPGRAIVMPCLHDEPYAALDLFRPLVADAAAVWFLSGPERHLAHRLGPVARREVVTGAGVTVPDGYDAAGFRARHGLERPYVVYAGRREAAKGWDFLADTFVAARRRFGLELDLVTVGVGDLQPRHREADNIVDLGRVGADEVADAFAAAAASVQPSRNESFSRTIMESWLAGTPVVADARGDVVAWHLRRSGAGLVYEDDHGLARCLQLVAEEPGAMRELAGPGRDYVLRNYTWDTVLDRMEQSVEALS